MLVQPVAITEDKVKCVFTRNSCVCHYIIFLITLHDFLSISVLYPLHNHVHLTCVCHYIIFLATLHDLILSISALYLLHNHEHLTCVCHYIIFLTTLHDLILSISALYLLHNHEHLTCVPLWCGVRIAPLPFPRYVVRGD